VISKFTLDISKLEDDLPKLTITGDRVILGLVASLLNQVVIEAPTEESALKRLRGLPALFRAVWVER
jgi:hypothetical protein